MANNAVGGWSDAAQYREAAPGDGRSRRRLLTAAIALAAMLSGLLAGTAAAGTVELRGKTIAIEGSGDRDRLLIRQRSSVLRIEEHNRDLSLKANGPECTAEEIDKGRSRVECPLEGIKKIRVSTGGGNDRVGIGSGLPSAGDRNFCRGSALDPKLIVRTGGGRDVAELSKGADRARGGAGRDLIMGCQGADALRGGGGRDRLSGDRGSDSLSGGKGKDWIVGCRFDPDDTNFPAEEPGSDELRGGKGSDFLYGCDGDDTYQAGPGSDDLNTRDGRAEQVECSTGEDLVYGDVSDRLVGCEKTTNCTTDNFPFLPCSLRLAPESAGASRLGSAE